MLLSCFMLSVFIVAMDFKNLFHNKYTSKYLFFKLSYEDYMSRYEYKYRLIDKTIQQICIKSNELKCLMFNN